MNRENSLGIFAILLLLGLGYFIPAVILGMEDASRREVEKTITMDEIELNMEKENVIEQLRIFPEMMFSRIVIQMDESKENAEANVQQSEPSTEQRNDENNLKLSIQELWLNLKATEELSFEKFSFGNYIMMASHSSDSLYSIWECEGVDKEGNIYRFWIDDITGKILAFDIPYSSVGNTDGEFYAAMNGICMYYSFSSYEFVEVLRNLNKQKYWENGLTMYDKNENVEVSIPVFKSEERLMFNIYSYTKPLSETK